MRDLRAQYPRIPELIFEALERHRTQTQAWPHGGFLTAVLANDLMESVGRADVNSLAALPEIVSYVYMELPSPSHGSYERVADWIDAPRAEKATNE